MDTVRFSAKLMQFRSASENLKQENEQKNSHKSSGSIHILSCLYLSGKKQNENKSCISFSVEKVFYMCQSVLY
jgi:hypothetical protein